MDDKIATKTVMDNTQWSIERFDYLIKEDRYEDAIALNEEFDEWINFSFEGGFEDPDANMEVYTIS